MGADDNLPPQTLQDLEACLAHLGTRAFVYPFLTLVGTTGADQIMIFAYHADRASCLMSCNFGHEPLGQRLAAEYLAGWYRRDPLFERVRNLDVGTMEQHRLADLAALIPAEYSRRFYDVPGLCDKRSVLVAGARLRIQVNLYWRQSAPDHDPLIALLARVALIHFEASQGSKVPQALAVLSDRERDVCLGILAGKKAEIIAHELGIKPATVVTYRSRAYEKLGIGSRGSLFAICRP